MKNVLILHGYSADNIGDGLLVYEAIELLKQSYDNPIITVLSSYPHSFNEIPNVTYIRSKPSIFGYNLIYLKHLFGMNQFDSIIGVGGGYLRSAGFKESLGTLLTHFPQLLFASRLGYKTIYLPQSIGPLGIFLRKIYKILLSNMKVIYLRDDRSVTELGIANAQRVPDMAILKIAESYVNNKFNSSVDLAEDYPVLSVRKVKGNIPQLFFKLAERFPIYDSYIQSSVGGNNDLEVSALLTPKKCIKKEEFMLSGEPRVLVAVRLHAALMAIEQGHFVVHLSYERKGFSAFKDLGLEDFVFNVNNFDVDVVEERVKQLLNNEEMRCLYKKNIIDRLPQLLLYREQIIKNIQDI